MKPSRLIIAWIVCTLVCSYSICQGQVIINEVFYDPPGNDTGFETIELLNTGTDPFNLDTFELKTADSNYYAFNGFVLDAGARVLVHNNAIGDDTPTDLYTGPLANMGNTHSSVALFSGPHAAGNIVDFVQYGGPGEQWESAAVAAGIWTEDDFAVDVDEGFSLNLDPDGIDTNSSTDWAACEPSPLEPNCSPLPTATATPTEPPTATATAAPPTATPTVGPPTATPTVIPPTATPTANPPTNTPTAPPSPTTTATDTPEPTPPESVIVINEVFTDPEGNDTGFEFIEILNVTGNPVELTGYDLKPDDAAYFTFPEFTLNGFSRVAVHINTEGTNTQTELFAGLSSNMGNSSGFVALFNETTHGSASIIDYMEYGAAGQTWESAAIDAGIWSEGDFIIPADEGFSMNLDPDGIDTNNSTDWAACAPSMLDINCQSLPSPTPTPTNTSGPGTPTATMPPTQTPTPTMNPTSPPANVVINEVFYDPDGNDTGLEFIELLNTSPDPLDMTGYDLKPDDASYYTFPTFVLAAYSRVVVHVNTEGTNTQEELYTGPSSNMGNSSGFIALFNDTTHGSTTLIDYVEYGEGGQTWESAAVDAGIWTAGDFVPVVDEGLSMNLDPDGIDTNNSTDWAACAPSMLDVNCQSLPSPTPTDTAGPGTPTATPEPTATPSERRGVVINEVFFDPDGADTGLEYIELFNNSADPVVLTGHDLKPDDAAYYTIPEFTLMAGAYVVVHINASGTNTSTDLYTGPSSNMGNSAGFVALFNDVTHSSNTIIDYIEYGEGGQTWESTAVSAGIWTAGDFIPLNEPEGLSINLCPNGSDLDVSDNWQLDVTSPGSANTCNSPTPTPTQTPTPEPTRTPTATPTPHPTVEPVIRLGGFGESDYQANAGGQIRILAWVTDPESDIERVWVTLGGEWVTDLYDDGEHDDFGAGDGFYGYALSLPPTIGGPVRLQMRIHAVDALGYRSHVWPLFTVDSGTGSSQKSTPAWWDVMAGCDSGSYRAPGDQRPFVYMAGFMETRISESQGGEFTFLAVTTGPLPIAYVELYYMGLPTGVYLLDDGLHNDFGPGDGVFGMNFSVGPGVLPAGDYPLQLRAVDTAGNKSDLWPYLTITE